jgi:uncharacterized protein
MKAQDIIDLLQLKPHPKEKGFFTETYRSRNSTAIYFLLTADGFSEMHRLDKDEIFHFYDGYPAELLLLPPDGKGQILKFGNSITNGEQPQIIIPAGSWQVMRTTDEYTLCGCTVSPAFEYADYEKGIRKRLIKSYPEFAEKITQLTDPDE